MKWLYWVVGIVSALLAFWFYLFPTDSYNVKITLVVRDGGIEKSVSTVIRAVEKIDLPTPVDLVPVTHAEGEGALLELSKGRNLILLLTTYDPEPKLRGSNTIGNIFRATDEDRTTAKKTLLVPYRFQSVQMKRLIGRRYKLRAPNEYALATISDFSNPETGRVITPDEIASALGSDIEYVGQFIEITTLPMTKQISESLPQLYQHEYPVYDDNGRMAKRRDYCVGVCLPRR